MNGFTEILTWILCSYKENFSMLNRKDDKSTAVIIGNPRSADFEVCLFNNCSQWWCAYLYSLKKYVSATISWNINLLFGFLMLIEMGFLSFFFFLYGCESVLYSIISFTPYFAFALALWVFLKEELILDKKLMMLHLLLPNSQCPSSLNYIDKCL